MVQKLRDLAEVLSIKEFLQGRSTKLRWDNVENIRSLWWSPLCSPQLGDARSSRVSHVGCSLWVEPYFQCYST